MPVVNILVDVVHGLLDPRLMEQGMSSRSSRKLSRDLPAMLGLAIVVFVLLLARVRAAGSRPIRATPRPRTCCAA